MSLSAYLLLTVKQTLGSVNHNISAIPMPASAMKRSSSIANFAQPPHTGAHARSTSTSRMSIMGRPSQPVFQRSSSGTDLASMGASTAQRPSASSTFGSTGRKSYAPTGSATPGAAVHMARARSAEAAYTTTAHHLLWEPSRAPDNPSLQQRRCRPHYLKIRAA